MQYLGASDSKVDTFTVTAADGTTKDVSFTIHGTNDVVDTTAPTATITGISSRAGNNGTATFTVTFSEAVTNVTVDDFQLSGTSLKAAPFPSITSVAGSGTTYTVVVAYDGRQPNNGDRGNTLGLNLKSGTDV